MKQAIKSILLKTFRRAGFYPVRILSPEVFYKWISKKPIAVQEHELNRMAQQARLTDDHAYYNGVLKQFVPEWKPSGSNQKFTPNGIGGSSMNSTRTFYRGDSHLFEKVYFSSHTEFYNTKWFYKYIYPSIKNDFHVPNLLDILPGDIISIAYFEHVDLKPIPANRIENRLVEIQIKLYNLSKSSGIKTITQESPQEIKNFRRHFEYKRNIDSAKNDIIQHGIEINKVEERIKNIPHAITHGDLHKTNVFDSDIIIDWDAFGLYPIGFDPAFTYFRLIIEDQKDNNYSTWLYNNFESHIDPDDWDDFIYSTTYFLYIFAQRFFVRGDRIELKRNLIEELKIIESQNSNLHNKK